MAALCAAALAVLDTPAATASHRTLSAPPLPAAVAAIAPGLKAQGSGELRYFGFAVYEGWYWGPGHRWTPEEPYALDLRYERDLAGAAIAQRSVEEMERIGLGTVAQRDDWSAALRRIFPDVVKGDHLTGLNLPPGIVRYFHNGKPIGEIVDPAFARAFFGIWFDPATSHPDFRRRLLGAP